MTGADPTRRVSRRARAPEGATGPPSRRVGYTHLPFAGRRRACIGEHLAMAELALAVAAVVGRYRLRSLLDVPNVEVDLALRPRGELPCRFEPIGPRP